MRHLGWLVLLLLLGCSSGHHGAPDGGAHADASVAAADGGPPPGTPVRVARVERRTLEVTVTGPGRTDALEQQQVRAPFAGKLLTLDVADGDHVKGGQLLGTIVSEESEGALVGAKAMLRTARTPQARRDARRALKMAEKGLVRVPLRAPEAAVVVKHAADEGSRVAAGQDLVSLAASDSFVFIAAVVQPDLQQVHPGERAIVRLASQAQPLAGTVHSILPAASATDLTVPVRIDLTLTGPLALNLFGTATIVVGQAIDVITVPGPAVLRNDVAGTERVATVTPEGTAHWVQVKTGLREGGFVQLTSPALPPGTSVILQGQVGLPEGTPVRSSP